MLELTNLRVLHKDMKNRGENQAVFNIQINNKYFSCIFITNVTPYYLYLATVGNTVKTFEFEVVNGYKINTYINKKDFQELCSYLDIKYDINHKFSTNDFFAILNNKIPTIYSGKPTRKQLIDTVSKHRNIEEADKTYFLKFRHLPEGQNVSEGNYEKTRLVFGDKIALDLKSRRISTCWTDDATAENIRLLNHFL
ncbi:MAG: DUF6037 family protein [Acutalibacteraceae bacterium]|nr:DUF6037 family protein [Acutalibacteraceae bacterium]